MKLLLNKPLRVLRKESRENLLSHVESRLATLSKRSIVAQMIRNFHQGRKQPIDFSGLNQESLAYLADALNKGERR